MRAVLQRVASAKVRARGRVVGGIAGGLLLYLGVEAEDAGADLEYMLNKISGLRIFADESGDMNRNIKEAGGALLIVSQFTLSGDARRGRRPSFKGAERPARAKELYKELIARFKGAGFTVETGSFGAHMEVESVNDGPVTLLLSSRRLF